MSKTTKIKHSLKEIILRLLLVISICLLGGGLLEVYVRVFAPHWRLYSFPGDLMVQDPLLGWRLAKAVRGNHKSAYFDVEYQTNSLGYRDQEREINGTEDLVDSASKKYRLLLYGDSQIFGWGQDQKRRFSNLIQEEMPDVEIWNMAVPGYGLDQQLLSYQRDSILINADLVVFFLSKATIFRLSTNYFSGLYKPMFELDSKRELKTILPQGYLSRYQLFQSFKFLELSYFIDRRLGWLDDRLRLLILNTAEKSSKSELSPLVTEVINLALQTAQERKQHVLLLLNLADKSQSFLDQGCRINGVQCLALRFSEKDEDLRIGAEDPHWNSLAHRIVTKQLIKRLKLVIQ